MNHVPSSSSNTYRCAECQGAMTLMSGVWRRDDGSEVCTPCFVPACLLNPDPLENVRAQVRALVDELTPEQLEELTEAFAADGVLP